MNIVEHEYQRGRWRGYRRRLNLIDTSTPDFATNGLSRLVDDPTVRFLVLPGDPEASIISEFEDAFWTWWMQSWPDPITGASSQWGDHSIPSAHAAVRGDYLYDGKVGAYAALHRCGALEVELGAGGALPGQQARVFRLLRITGRVWQALDLYRQVLNEYAIGGPWEITLALRNTQGALLGGFGTGWLEPGDFRYRSPPCLEPNLLWRHELSDWPDAGGVQALAMLFGGWIEDAWGSRHRRFRAYGGQAPGQFDQNKFASYSR